MKKLLLTSAMLLSFNATAALITESGTFGTQGSTSDAPIDNGGFLDEEIIINGFDTSLGTLTSVDITVFGQIDSEGSSQNISTTNGRADVGLFIYQDWKVSSSVANDFVFRAGDFVNPFLFDESAPPGTLNLEPGTANDTFTYSLSSGEISGSLTGVDLSAFTSGSPITFDFDAFAQTSIGNEVESGTGFFTNSFATGSWGKVEVAYTFDAAPTTSVPEPATIALLGLAAMGMARSRKNK